MDQAQLLAIFNGNAAPAAEASSDGDDETGGEGTVDETAPEADGEEF